MQTDMEDLMDIEPEGWEIHWTDNDPTLGASEITESGAFPGLYLSPEIRSQQPQRLVKNEISEEDIAAKSPFRCFNLASLQEMGWRDARHYRASFGDDEESLRQAIFVLFPGLQVQEQEQSCKSKFLEALLKPDSNMFRAIFDHMAHPYPTFTDESMIVLALLGQPDRIADVEIIIDWILAVFPSERGRRLHRGPNDDLRVTVRAFFEEQLWLMDRLFEPVDPWCHPETTQRLGMHPKWCRLWTLRSNTENVVFNELYSGQDQWPPSSSDSSTYFANPLNAPHRSLETPSPREYTGPVTWRQVVMGHSVRPSGPLFPVVTPSGDINYYARAPKWSGSTNTYPLRLMSGFGWNKLPPLPFLWDSLVLDTFFCENKIVLRIGHALNWLRALQTARRAIHNVEIALSLSPGDLNETRRVVELLGESESLSKLTVHVERRGAEKDRTKIGDSHALQPFRRFRGLDEVYFVFNEAGWSEEAHLSHLTMPLKQWSTNEHVDDIDKWERRMKRPKPPRPLPQQALQPAPKKVKSMACQSLADLLDIAESHGWDRTRKATKKYISEWILDQQAKYSCDSDDDVDALKG
jgi:hypothetical protein